jgi:putative CocE/NonD family hydrolase
MFTMTPNIHPASYCPYLNKKSSRRTQFKILMAFLLMAIVPSVVPAQTADTMAAFISRHYTKMERMVPMRDGVRLFTAIYVPRDNDEKYPILMQRTPYSCSPYGENHLKNRLGPNPLLAREKYIFVYQDVRGRYRSEGDFEEMTPARDFKKSNADTDESSDTYDTIDWLLKNVRGNNGKVGIYGISYPGFYATASLPGAHPAIKAVSPQAPVTDEFIGDDAYHNGAFFLMDNFDFTNYFQGTRIDSGKNYKNAFSVSYADAYRFYLDLGPIKNTNSERYFGGKAKIWNEYLQHDVYDSYWQSRNIRPHLRDIKPAVLVVGGWFDAEDLFGSLRTYEAIEQQTPENNNRIVMGPWTHGAWSAGQWNHFGPLDFGANLNEFYQAEIETKFFNYYLKGKGDFSLEEATVFETGTNKWKSYSSWPPTEAKLVKYYLGRRGSFSTASPTAQDGYDEYESDPSNPVPYTGGTYPQRNNEYMVEDQRFAAARPDVLVYQSDTLSADLTLTGRLKADIYISSSGTDADLVVKVIDVIPEAAGKSVETRPGGAPGGFERLVRAEVFRCKFRNSYEKPQALEPGKPAEVAFSLNEIAHTFKKGHRIMVQVQSSWFPLVDRNPQQFLSIPACSESDFKKATIRVYHDELHPSSIQLPIIY